jgi:TolB protein
MSGCGQALPETPNSTTIPTKSESVALDSTPNAASPQEVILLAMEENGYAHLFLYLPLQLPLTRLTYGDWDDIDPALSPDGGKVAFASNRDGQWDLYVLEILTGEILRLTDTPEYEASPSWSPDNQWLACERYQDENLEIAIVSLVNPEQEIIFLTQDPAFDHSPAWAPDGRHVAYVSNRAGNNDIWLADLDKTGEDRILNLSRTPGASESQPVWTTDGHYLAWASSAQNIGYSGIYVWDAIQPERAAVWIGEGDFPAWNTDGDKLTAILHSPNQEYLTTYAVEGELLLQPVPLPGPVRGIAWPALTLSETLTDIYSAPASQTPIPEWTVAVTPLAEGPSQRYAINTLNDVRAPYPQLHDLVDESFTALRERIINETGWDALAGLSNAFVPLTTTLDPGLGEDWLYTGRAFALNPLMSNAGWMAAVRQDYGNQTYWTLYLRTLSQDGTQGEPLHDPPWDLSARYNLDPRVYEQGGTYASVPPGYWVNFTALARQYGWERVPALPNWRSYYNGARFTEFALTDGLDWYSAMLEIYPKDILVTPTRILPPSPTPTITPIPTDTLTPSRTPRPTGTITSTRTATVTFTASVTPTQPPSPVPTLTVPVTPTP